jgi:group I intron endonuclease
MKYIYKITNKVDGKVYIGQTNNPNRRLYNHVSAKKGRLGIAISQFGKNSFTMDILATALSDDCINELEVLMIKQYNAQDLEVGYNTQAGGQPFPIITEEGREKLRNLRLGSKHSDNTIAKMSKSRSKKIYCPELQVVFFSVKDAAESIGLKIPGNISRHLKTKQWKVKGLTFFYYDNLNDYKMIQNAT